MRQETFLSGVKYKLLFLTGDQPIWLWCFGTNWNLGQPQCGKLQWPRVHQAVVLSKDDVSLAFSHWKVSDPAWQQKLQLRLFPGTVSSLTRHVVNSCGKSNWNTCFLVLVITEKTKEPKRKNCHKNFFLTEKNKKKTNRGREPMIILLWMSLLYREKKKKKKSYKHILH